MPDNVPPPVRRRNGEGDSHSEALDNLYRRGQFATHPNGLPVLVLLDLALINEPLSR
jgi:hypothetical protein